MIMNKMSLVKAIRFTLIVIVLVFALSGTAAAYQVCPPGLGHCYIVDTYLESIGLWAGTGAAVGFGVTGADPAGAGIGGIIGTIIGAVVCAFDDDCH